MNKLKGEIARARRQLPQAYESITLLKVGGPFVCNRCGTEVSPGGGHFHGGGGFHFYWCSGCEDFAEWECDKRHETQAKAFAREMMRRGKKGEPVRPSEVR